MVWKGNAPYQLLPPLRCLRRPAVAPRQSASPLVAARLGGLLRQPAHTACLRSCVSSPRSSSCRRHFATVAMGGSAGGQRVVLWFRGTDLRLHDNAPVAEAARRVQVSAWHRMAAARPV